MNIYMKKFNGRHSLTRCTARPGYDLWVYFVCAEKQRRFR